MSLRWEKDGGGTVWFHRPGSHGEGEHHRNVAESRSRDPKLPRLGFGPVCLLVTAAAPPLAALHTAYISTLDLDGQSTFGWSLLSSAPPPLLQGMAGRLAEHLRSGHAAGFDPSLLVFNRTASVAEAFASNTGATAVKAVADLAATATVVFSMLPNDAVADAVRHCCRRRCCRYGVSETQPFPPTHPPNTAPPLIPALSAQVLGGFLAAVSATRASKRPQAVYVNCATILPATG